MTKPLLQKTVISISHSPLAAPHDLIFSLLKKCLKTPQLKQMHAIMVKISLSHDSFAVNQFVSACSSTGSMDYAISVFAHLQKPNIFVWNSMIKGFVHCHSYQEAISMYKKLLVSSVSATSYTFSSVIKACTQVFGLSLGKSIHGQALKWGLNSQVFVGTALIDLYSNCSEIINARKVFDEMEARDAVAFTAMISGHCRIGELAFAQELFDAMPEKSTASWNALIDGYSKGGDIEKAASLFDEMSHKDLVSWTTMISSFSKNGRFKEAIAVFKTMEAQTVSPDAVTMATVISACAHLGGLDFGREIHNYVSRNVFNLDVFIGSSLIDMYAKCGSLERSLLVFYKLLEKNLFCWNSMVEGLAMHGHGTQAIKLFEKMERSGVKPNGVTFVGVLSACAHIGLVEIGQRYFYEMTHEHGIMPWIEHYGCMVDLLGRAGHLEEAVRLMESMEMEPNAVIWGALLGGCKIHGNVGLAEIAVKNLLELEPGNSGYYVLLANIYAEENRWDEVARIRVLMRERRVQKAPGFSSVEIGGKVHEFVACGMSHPQSEEIYGMLDEMVVHLNLAGYVPDVGFISEKMGVDEREGMCRM
ncbi:hypothetical protein AMTRI_Chr07g29720 [Amborella trichopoda]